MGLANSIFITPDALFVRLPVMESVLVMSPLAMPGERVPLLVRVDVPRSKVPAPDNVPALVKPAVLLNVAPDATLIVPDCVSALVMLSVPLLTLTTPVAWLLNTGVNGELMTVVLSVLRNSPALLKVPVPCMP